MVCIPLLPQVFLPRAFLMFRPIRRTLRSLSHCFPDLWIDPRGPFYYRPTIRFLALDLVPRFPVMMGIDPRVCQMTTFRVRVIPRGVQPKSKPVVSVPRCRLLSVSFPPPF